MVRSPHHFVKNKLVERLPSLHHEHTSYRWWVLLNIMMGTFIAVLDATIVNVGLTKIMTSFGTTVDKAEWIITAYMLAFAIMLPTSGWVADHLGYKRTYFGALFLFTFGSFLCGLAWNENVLIVSRVIQGMGAGFLMPVGMAIVMREFPYEQRGMALGFWGVAAAASISFGPLIGGYLIDNVSWHAIFDVNVPIGIFGMFATLIIQREYRAENIKSFDIVGFVSMSVFLTSLLLALSEGNAVWNNGGWTSTYILTCFSIAAAGLAVFLANELTVAHPLIDLSLFKDFNFAVTSSVMFIFGLGMFGSTFLMPLFLQTSLGYTALMAGMLFLPLGMIQAVIGPISGILSDKINPKIPALIGIALLAVSLYLNNFLSLFSERAQIMIPLLIRGFAMGMVFTPLSTLAISNIPKERMAQASGLFNVVRQIGGSFGIALFGTILARRLIYHTAMFGQLVNQYSPVFQNTMRNMQFSIQQSVGGTTSETALRARALIAGHVAQQAFVRAVDDAFFIAGAITVVAVIPILMLKVKKKKKTAYVPATEEQMQ